MRQAGAVHDEVKLRFQQTPRSGFPYFGPNGRIVFRRLDALEPGCLKTNEALLLGCPDHLFVHGRRAEPVHVVEHAKLAQEPPLFMQRQPRPDLPYYVADGCDGESGARDETSISAGTRKPPSDHRQSAGTRMS